ncbi:MAG TPA: integrase core domain-containing protein [Solirubrobacterales bacterium]|nr:integrase core domain-containing protein [Solirubrobacterales bacterium]
MAHAAPNTELVAFLWGGYSFVVRRPSRTPSTSGSRTGIPPAGTPAILSSTPGSWSRSPKGPRVLRARTIRLAKAAIKKDSTPALISFNVEAVALEVVGDEDETLVEALQRFFDVAVDMITAVAIEDPGAYGRLYGSSAERSSQLAGWLDRYNYHRKHGSLGRRSPAARLSELLGNNLLGNYS